MKIMCHCLLFLKIHLKSFIYNRYNKAGDIV